LSIVDVATVEPLPAHGAPGVLLVLEGIDRSGRSTQVRRLEAHLRFAGHGVTRTALGGSLLAGSHLQAARRDRGADPVHIALLSAADLAERVDTEILPSLRAGLVVLADRYCWTPMARAEARSVDPDWLAHLFSFAPRPDAILYLDVSPDTSLDRRTRAPDPYEAGIDAGLSDDLMTSYRLFQSRLHDCFERFAGWYGFTPIPQGGSINAIAGRIARIADAAIASHP
jgi:dTMP kinase